MRRNVAGQFIGCQLISKTDGSAVTAGTTTVYITGDAGTQGAGSVGSGACTHEGNGYWTYAPSQGETNFTQVAFTFVNASACNATVQVFTTAYDASGRVDVGAVLGTAQTARDLGAQLDAAISSRMATYTQPSGFLSATFPTGTIANTANITGGTITTVTNLINAPTAGDLTATMKASVTAAVPTAAAIGTDAASKVLVTPAQKLVTDASGYATANLNGDLTATMKASVTAAVPTASAIGTDAAGKVLVTPSQKIVTDVSGNVRALDATGAALATQASVDVIDATADAIYGKVSNLSISNRLQTTLPASIIRAAAGDKYIEVDMFLTDVDGNMFDSRDHDGGDWSNNSHFTLGSRVKPTTNNAGGYFFEMTTFNGTDAGGTAADWSTAQTPTQTCVSGNGDTYTNIGTTPGVTDKHNGFGIVVSDDMGNPWTLYSDAVGTALPIVNECHHHGESSMPQIVPRLATGTYRFYMNIDDAEAERSIHFYIAWFDLARWEAGYTSVYHRRQLAQMQITATADLSAESIADAVLDEVVGDHLGGGSMGALLSSMEGRLPASLILGRVDVTVGAYQAGQTPADSVLITPENKLATDISGNVSSSIDTAAIADAVAAEILLTPANKLATDANGYVTEASVDGIKKNTALNNFEFLMVDSADHVTAKTGLTVTGTRSIDGGTFGACGNSITEVGSGIYKIDMASSDLNGDVITFKFSASGADTRFITIKTNT